MLTNPSVTETAVTHTPGPWDYTSTAMGYAVTAELMDRVGTPTIVLAEVRDDIDVSDTKANARLIAAAPELLDALKTILQGFADGVFVRDLTHDAESDWARRLVPFITALNRAQAAIAKAEGVNPSQA